jgi:methyl-accepting chemotaxis protein
MAGNSHQIVEITRQSASQSRVGLEAVEKTIAAGRQGAEYYRRLNYSFNELSAQTTSVRRVLHLLKSITSETHLLALNASIEAAGAGTHGERFGVVAQEIKGLAARASAAQNEVVTLVEKIEQANEQAIEAVEAGFAKAHEIEATAQATGETIRQTLNVAEQAETQAHTVNESAQNLKQLSEVIRQATSHQRRAHEQVLESIAELLTTIQQNSEGNRQIGATVNDLEDMSGRLRLSLTESSLRQEAVV